MICQIKNLLSKNIRLELAFMAGWNAAEKEFRKKVKP